MPAARVAYANYVALAGDGEAMGDGVIPVACAHLPGALQLTLDGVSHSFNEPGTTLPADCWYGSEAVVGSWMPAVLGDIGGLGIPKVGAWFEKRAARRRGTRARR